MVANSNFSFMPLVHHRPHILYFHRKIPSEGSGPLRKDSDELLYWTVSVTVPELVTCFV